ETVQEVRWIDVRLTIKVGAPIKECNGGPAAPPVHVSAEAKSAYCTFHCTTEKVIKAVPTAYLWLRSGHKTPEGVGDRPYKSTEERAFMVDPAFSDRKALL
uniref:Ig-like domain-containing protein n=1 Tax=Bursaphelenchus xylophilus TaxID=6326 RepID=A0A1I7SKN7_BURXY